MGTWAATSSASTAYQNPTGQAFFVSFESGSPNYYYKTHSFYVRLVRGGQSLDSFDVLPAPVTNYAISATANPPAGGSVNCTPNPVPSGGTSTCTATPNAGYSFTAWSGDCSGATCVLSNITAARTVVASFTAAPVPTASVASIPTLSEWAMILLATLMAMLGLARVRRKPD